MSEATKKPTSVTEDKEKNLFIKDVEVIGEETEEITSIASIVAERLYEVSKRKPLRKKPIILILDEKDGKGVSENMVKLGKSIKKSDEDGDPTILTIGGKTKANMTVAVEGYLELRKLQHTDNLDLFLEQLGE